MQISPLRIDYRCILQHRQTSRILSDNIYRPCTNSTEKMKTGDLPCFTGTETRTTQTWDGPKGAPLLRHLSPPPTCSCLPA